MCRHASRDMRAVLVAAAIALGMTLIVSGAASSADAASFSDIKLKPERNLSSEQAGRLRTDAQEIAEPLKIAPLVERLRAQRLALTRRQILIKHWEAFEKLNSKDERRLKKLAAAPSYSERLNESIRIVSQRMDLLHGLRTHIEEFDTELYELHQAITLD